MHKKWTSGPEARAVQIDFSAAFDRVNHQGILYNLCSVGTGGSVWSILTKFQSNQPQHVMVDGCRSKLVNVLSLQSCVLGPLLIFLYTSELFSILENKKIGYADDSTSLSVVPSPGVRIAVAESLNRDHGKTSESCDLCGMKLKANKTKTMIVARSRSMHPQSHQLTISGTVLKEKEYDDLDYSKWHLLPRWLLRSIFARFPKQLLKGLVSWGSPDDNYMIDCFLGDALGVLSCQFRSTVLQCGAWLPIHTLNDFIV